MWLLIDAGNTRVKWAFHDGEQWLGRGSADHASLDALAVQWAALPAPRRVVGCNVAGPEVKATMERLALMWRLPVDWLTPNGSRLGVRNGYSDPAQLGADRWAALLAAPSLHTGDCLVVNVGTAMTVDALTASGQHLGGIIAPGFRLMQQALAGGTADLGSRSGCFTPFPGNTADAIHGGIMQSLIGAVSRMAGEMKLSGCPASACVLSGGDAHLLRPYINLKVLLVENLVLEGLLRVVKE